MITAAYLMITLYLSGPAHIDLVGSRATCVARSDRAMHDEGVYGVLCVRVKQ